MTIIIHGIQSPQKMDFGYTLVLCVALFITLRVDNVIDAPRGCYKDVLGYGALVKVVVVDLAIDLDV